MHLSRRRDDLPRPSVSASWDGRLDAARTVQDVLDIARDFIASFSPEEVQALPERCQLPTKLFEEDVCAYAYELMRTEVTANAADDALHKLAPFFSHACGQLALLHANRAARPPYVERRA
jgi:hypothetical protein